LFRKEPSIKPLGETNVISALGARSQFGRILEETEKRGRSFVIEKRGAPKAVLLSIRDYIRLAAPEPEVLKQIGEGSRRRKTDALTPRQVERVIRAARTARRRAAA
jgi:prevent-host-death family protein